MRYEVWKENGKDVWCAVLAELGFDPSDVYDEQLVFEKFMDGSVVVAFHTLGSGKGTTAHFPGTDEKTQQRRRLTPEQYERLATVMVMA